MCWSRIRKKTVKDSVGLYYRPSVADINLLADHCLAFGHRHPAYPDRLMYVHVVCMYVPITAPLPGHTGLCSCGMDVGT